MLATARLLQHYAGVSDAEVVERCRYDLRWKVALDLDLASIQAPFVKSTFQAFRVRLTLHAQEGLVFERSVQAARQAGLLPARLRVALDSTPVRGRGAVKDTFNLLSDAIVAVVRAIAAMRERTPEEVAREARVERHLACASIKGSELVDWGDAQAVDRSGGLPDRAHTADDGPRCGASLGGHRLRKHAQRQGASRAGRGGPGDQDALPAHGPLRPRRLSGERGRHDGHVPRWHPVVEGEAAGERLPA